MIENPSSLCVAATYDDNIKEFSKRHQLQCTLQCLLDPLSTYDMPSKVSKFMTLYVLMTEVIIIFLYLLDICPDKVMLDGKVI